MVDILKATQSLHWAKGGEGRSFAWARIRPVGCLLICSRTANCKALGVGSELGDKKKLMMARQSS